MNVSVVVGQVWEPLNAKGRRRLILCSGTNPSGKNSITWCNDTGEEGTVLFSSFTTWIRDNGAQLAQ